MKTLFKFFAFTCTATLLLITCSKENLIEEGSVEKNLLFNFQPRVQEFEINAGENETITGEEGMQVLFPANCFLNQNGTPVTGTIEINIQEVTTQSATMLSGITTATDEGLLQSGGMIYIDASQNGQELIVNPASSLMIIVPASE